MANSPLRTKISDATTTSMKSGDSAALQVLRMLASAIKNKDIEARTADSRDGIDDTLVLGLLQNQIKQRRESIDLYTKGGRPELAAKEQAEILIIEQFLPAQMDEAAALAAITALATELGATNIKDMGRVMNELKTRFAGQMDMSKASQWVKTALGG